MVSQFFEYGTDRNSTKPILTVGASVTAKMVQPVMQSSPPMVVTGSPMCLYPPKRTHWILTARHHPWGPALFRQYSNRLTFICNPLVQGIVQHQLCNPLDRWSFQYQLCNPLIRWVFSGGSTPAHHQRLDQLLSKCLHRQCNNLRHKCLRYQCKHIHKFLHRQINKHPQDPQCNNLHGK